MSVIFRTRCPDCSEEIKTDVFKKNINGEIYIDCGKCNHRIFIKTLFETPVMQNTSEETCPKCGALKSKNGKTCSKCGLVYEKWIGAKEPFSENSELESMWKQLKNVDIQSDKHDLFLEKCFSEGFLDEAARAYSLLSREENIDVSSRLRQIGILAQIAIPSEVRKKKISTNWIYVFIMTLFGIFFLWLLYFAE